MTLETRMKKAYENLKAPEGKFVVCVWDPANPEKSIPVQISNPYTVEGSAIGYAKRMNTKGQPDIGEREYFVVDDRGTRVY